MIPNGGNIIEETHDEKKINVNHDFINSNVGWKNHHILKIDMRNFDGKDLITCILQMEQYFDLNNVKTHTKGTHSNFRFRTKYICMVSMALLP